MKKRRESDRELVKNLKGLVESTTVANLFLLNFKSSTFCIRVWESEGRIFNGHVRSFLVFFLVAYILLLNQHEHFVHKREHGVERANVCM